MDRVIDKTPDRIAGMFDAIAGRYDLLNHLLSAGLDRRWRTRAARALGTTGRETVLDLCTGTADLAIALTRGRTGAARVVGIDFAARMLHYGRRKLAARALDGRIALLRGDAAALPLADGAVDGATVAFGIRNVEDPRRVLGELHRVVRPDGRLVILEFGMPQWPGLRAAYAWYFRRLLPWLGRRISRHDGAYAYLPASVGAFPSGEAFCALLRAAGFVDPSATRLSLGVVYLYVARHGAADGGRRRDRPSAAAGAARPSRRADLAIGRSASPSTGAFAGAPAGTSAGLSARARGGPGRGRL